MSGYDYGNTRLRAMKSRLLSKRELDDLVETSSPQGLIAALTKTAYRKPVETALARTSGMNCIAEAFRYDLVHTFDKVRKFYNGQAGEMVAMVLRIYDIHNLKAILRGLENNAATSEILFTMLPIGDLKDNLLTELAHSPSPRAAIDILASIGLLFSHPLLNLRAKHPGAGIPEMELTLDRWFYQEIFQYLQTNNLAGNVLFSAMQLDADLINLLTLLRFSHSPGERKFLREWLHTDELDRLFVGPGKIQFTLLTRAGSKDNVNAAVETLASTVYDPSLRAGLNAYAQSALLSDFEKQLKRFRLKWMSRQIAKDPLGIGVMLGYLALKVNELSNVRWIAQGVNLGLKAEAIRTELEYTT